MKTNHRAENQGSQSARAKQSKSIRPPQRSTPAVIEEAGQGTPTPLTEHELRAHEEHLEQRRKQRNMQIVLHFPGLLDGRDWNDGVLLHFLCKVIASDPVELRDLSQTLLLPGSDPDLSIKCGVELCQVVSIVAQYRAHPE